MAVLFYLGQHLRDLSFLMLLGICGESLLLTFVPIAVEPSFALIAQMLRPDGAKSPKSAWGFDIPDDAHGDNRWTLENSDRLDDFLLMQLRSGLVHFAHHVGHPGLVSHEACQMNILLRLVSGERSYFATIMLAALSGQES